MIELTKEEMWAFNILATAIQNQQAEVQRSIAAQKAYISALELKYNATFNPATGEFKPKEEKRK